MGMAIESEFTAAVENVLRSMQCGNQPPMRRRARPSCDGSQYLDAATLAVRLGVTESWVVKHTRRSYTRYPIPCIRFGRSIRYDWNSEELQKWIKRSKQ